MVFCVPCPISPKPSPPKKNLQLFSSPLLNNTFFSGAMSGAWETKISHREKRQQRKRDKVQTDSGSLDSTIPGIENTITVTTEQLTTASFPVGSKKNKGILVEHKSHTSNPAPFNQMYKITLRQKLDYFELLTSLCWYTLLRESIVDHILVYLTTSSVTHYIPPNEWLVKLKLPFCLESHEKMMLPFFLVCIALPQLSSISIS